MRLVSTLFAGAAAVVTTGSGFVAANFITDNEDVILVGGEFEFPASKSTGGWSKVPLARVSCPQGVSGKTRTFEIQSEDDMDSGGKVEIVTTACPVADKECVWTQLKGIHELYKHMKHTPLVDGVVVDGCTVKFNSKRASVAKGLKITRNMWSAQASLGLPILYFHPAIQHKLESGSLKDLGNMLNRHEGFDPEPTAALTVTTTGTTSIGAYFRQNICNDKKVAGNGKMSKDSHPLLPKISFKKVGTHWARKIKYGVQKTLLPRLHDKFKFTKKGDACSALATGFNAEHCDWGDHTSFSGNNFPCFEIDKSGSVTDKAWSRVGFVGESRGPNKGHHLKVCLSHAVNFANRKKFDTCFDNFANDLNAIWEEAAKITGDRP